MGKSDYYTIVAKVLVYLYKKYKRISIDEDYISPMTKDFPIPKEQLDETIAMMMEKNFITGKKIEIYKKQAHMETSFFCNSN